VRSLESVAANYIEANESLRKKDFLLRIKICRKEATELMDIFGSIIRKSE
jgi:four helix bundle protein